MAGANKLVTAGGGGVILTPATSIASDVTVQIPSRAGNLAVDGPAFSAYQSSAQALTLNVFTKAQLQIEEFDTNSNFDNTTNYRFTPTVAGYYQITAAFSIAGTATGHTVSIYKNGSIFKQAPDIYANTAGSIVTALIYFNGSTDYVEMYMKTQVSQNTNPSSALTYFQGSLVRAA